MGGTDPNFFRTRNLQHTRRTLYPLGHRSAHCRAETLGAASSGATIAPKLTLFSFVQIMKHISLLLFELDCFCWWDKAFLHTVIRFPQLETSSRVWTNHLQWCSCKCLRCMSLKVSEKQSFHDNMCSYVELLKWLFPVIRRSLFGMFHSDEVSYCCMFMKPLKVSCNFSGIALSQIDFFKFLSYGN